MAGRLKKKIGHSAENKSLPCTWAERAFIQSVTKERLQAAAFITAP
jgi:hypothetical protein